MTEFAWVIEDPNSPAEAPLYWAASGPWSRSHLDAIRFSRKEDAEKVAQRVFQNRSFRICEHGWT